MNLPRQQFDKALNRNVRSLIRAIGIDILDENYQPNIVLVFICTMIFIFCIVCVKSIIYGDLETQIQCFTFLAIAFQCPVKIYAGVRYRRTYTRSMDYCRNIYREIERSASPILHQQCTKFSDIFCLLLNIHCIIVLSAGLLLLSSPLIAFVIFDIKYYPMLPTSLPWLDPMQDLGYALNTAQGTYLIFIAVLGILSSDAGFLILVVHTYLNQILISFKVQQINDKLRAFDHAKKKHVRRLQNDSNTHSMAKIVKEFQAIMDQHNAYYLYDEIKSNTTIAYGFKFNVF